MATQNNIRVLLFLAEGFEDLEAVTIMDVCGWTGYREHVPNVSVTTTGFHSEIHGRFGLAIKPDMLFEEVNPANYAALAIPGGFRDHGFNEVYDERVYGLLRTIYDQGGVLATMCVGILPVAEAGLLKGRRATCYPHSQHDNLARLRSLGAMVVDEPVVVDDQIISCAGPAQSIDVALLLLKSIIGPEAESAVARFLIYARNEE